MASMDYLALPPNEFLKVLRLMVVLEGCDDAHSGAQSKIVRENMETIPVEELVGGHVLALAFEEPKIAQRACHCSMPPLLCTQLLFEHPL